MLIAGGALPATVMCRRSLGEFEFELAMSRGSESTRPRCCCATNAALIEAVEQAQSPLAALLSRECDAALQPLLPRSAMQP